MTDVGKILKEAKPRIPATKSVSFTLPVEEIEEIDAIAEGADLERTDLLRAIVRQFMKEFQAATDEAIADDAASKANGPRD